MVMQQQDLVSQGGQGEQSASLCLQNKVLLHVQTPGCLMQCSIAVAASGSPFLNTRQYIVLQFASSGFRLATFGDCIVATLACCCYCGLRFWSETCLHGLSTEISASGILFERRNLSDIPVNEKSTHGRNKKKEISAREHTIYMLRLRSECSYPLCYDLNCMVMVDGTHFVYKRIDKLERVVLLRDPAASLERRTA